MNVIMHFMGFTALMVMLGCRAPSQPDASLEPIGDVELPIRLSESYLKSLEAVPELTAQRFLTAYKNLAAYGPVTQDKILDHARFQAASQRGQLLGALLAYDLNGDLEITRSEVDALAVMPPRHNKAIDPASLFEADKNGDDVISLFEATHHSRALYTQRAQKDMRPIESYLMLFDLNTNGVVTRTEMRVSLKPFMGREQERRSGGDAALP